MCWAHVAQIRQLLPTQYCKLDKQKSLPFDVHPMQYAVPLLSSVYKMACWYGEPNPYARKLAFYMMELLARNVTLWMEGEPVPVPESTSAPGTARGYASRLVYAPGQRLCYLEGEFWHEAVILRTPLGESTSHLLQALSGLSEQGGGGRP